MRAFPNLFSIVISSLPIKCSILPREKESWLRVYLIETRFCSFDDVQLRSMLSRTRYINI